MKNFLTFFFTLLFCGLSTKSVAQNEVDIHLVAARDLSLQMGINTFDFSVENRGGKDFDGYLRIRLPDGLESLNGAGQDIRILAGKKRYFSIKLRTSLISKLKNTVLLVSLYDRSNRKIEDQSIKINFVPIRSLVLQDLSGQQYLQKVGDSLRLRFLVRNVGTTDENIKILVSSPNKIGNSIFQEKQISLSAGQDSIIYSAMYVQKYMLDMEVFMVSVNGLYSSNDFFGSINIPFQNLSSNRNFNKLRGYSNSSIYSRNYISFQVNDLFAQQKNYYLNSEGQYRLYHGNLRYAVALNLLENYDPILNNTYLEYEKGKSTVTLGNIQENLDAPLYGRGIKYTLKDTATGQSYSVGAVERAIDLLGFYSSRAPGVSAFAKIILADNKPEKKRYEGQLYYDKNNLDSTRSLLWTNSFDLLKQKYADRLQIQGFFGAGVNQFSGSLHTVDSIRPSLATGLKINYKAKSWSFSSDNFISGNYYPGSRRGAAQFYQRINRRVNKFSLGAGYTFSRSTPEYINLRFNNLISQTIRYDLNFGIPFSTFINGSINPSYTSEKGSYISLQGIESLQSESWIGTVLANLRSRNYRHSIFLSFEPGMIRSGRDKVSRFALRSNLNYSYGNIGIYGTYQKGNFQIYDVLSSTLMNIKDNTRLSLGGRFQKDILEKKLHINVGANYNLNKGYADAYTINTSFDYRLFKNTLLSTNFQYSVYLAKQAEPYHYNNLRLGVRQNLRSADLESKSTPTGNIKVFCFYDNNDDGIFDTGDEKAADYGFSIGNTFFITDHQGISSFKNLPFGNYVLFFPLKDEYQAASFTFKMNARGTTVLQIPLNRTGRIEGTVELNYDPQLSVKVAVSLDQFRVMVRDSTGKLAIAKVDKFGSYQLNLAAGKYEIFMDKESLPESIIYRMDPILVDVTIAKTISVPPIEIEVKKKKIDIKKFGH